MSESLADTIEPKSDQMNADDLLVGPLTVRIEAVKRGKTADHPIEIDIAGHRPFKPCKSMRRVLILAWGDQGADWVGKSMTLYNDPSVKYGGVAVGGIRISHLTDIERPLELSMTICRGRRIPYVVQPLKVSPADYPQSDFDKNLSNWAHAVVNGKIDIPGILQRTAKKGAMTTAQREKLESVIADLTDAKENENASFDT